MKGPKGFLFSGVSSGVKKSAKLDLALVYMPHFAQGVFFFTDNRLKAAPLILDARKIKINNGRIKAIVVNSGNANCFTGKRGVKDAEIVCNKIANILGEKSRYVLASSTGIIGKRLPGKKILNSLPKLIDSLDSNPQKFSEAILTTDTFKKVSYREVKIKDKIARILGIAKGAGMIYPHLNQATMLAFIFTDADISRNLLERCAREAVRCSFNSISVDGCRSTNDSVFIAASKKAANHTIRKEGRSFTIFSRALREVCLDLAKMIVKDAEGASKFVQICIKGARTKAQAKRAGFSLANSNLFKCSLWGKASNWGRIVSALGQEGIRVKEGISMKIDNLRGREVKVTVDLKLGCAEGIVYSSDLTPQYVNINARYS